MSSEKTKKISKTEKKIGLFFIFLIGFSIFFWQLGSTGLFDETPPLFAAAGRAMSETGDWITPRVNGLTRFDKPPLIYWIMGAFYSFPGQTNLDIFGTWAARLPSAISSLFVMIFIGETMMSFPQREDIKPRRTAIVSSLGFALSPLVIIWSRIAVSDALLCSTLGISLLFHWRMYAEENNKNWFLGWIFLSLAVLTKGPVAVVLSFMVLFSFGVLQKDMNTLIIRIKPIKGIFLTLLLSLPWFVLEFLKEGLPFWKSFFGYHNFQRLTSVVNSHQQPWWFFGFILIIASFPFTPYLFKGIYDQFKNLLNFKEKRKINKISSLGLFSLCWLFSILLLFTCAATKLPSYWLPATPAAAILIGLSSIDEGLDKKIKNISWYSSLSLILLLSLAISVLPNWIYLINDPEMPDLAATLISSQLSKKGALIGSIFIFLFIFSYSKRIKNSIIFLQILFLLNNIFIVNSVWQIGDKLRQKPLREISNKILKEQKINEPIAMIGIKKPSVHFYTKKIILYESNDDISLINLAERLREEKRDGWQGRNFLNKNLYPQKTVLIIIDDYTKQYPHWDDLDPILLEKKGIYNLWRLKVDSLEKRELTLKSKGINSNWKLPRPERI